MRIWLIGGTQESRTLAQKLLELNCSVVVTVTTESAQALYPKTPNLITYVGALSPTNLSKFLNSYKIRCILDASHPFATQISKVAITAAQAYRLPYLRFERLSITPPPSSSQSFKHHLLSLTFPSFQELIKSNTLSNERVLLTIGYRVLYLFESYQDHSTLFARILPSQDALAAALNAGFTSDRLIALRPPVGVELERALWMQWKISIVVTKASGVPGGEDIKQQLANSLGIRLITITRPVMTYPAQTDNFHEALRWCQNQFNQS